jgi:hypothetical protein
LRWSARDGGQGDNEPDGDQWWFHADQGVRWMLSRQAG